MKISTIFIRFILSNFSCLDVSLNIMNDGDFSEINEDLNENSEHLNDNSSLFNVSLNGSIVCDILSPVANIATQVSPRSAPIGNQFFNSRKNACFCELYHIYIYFILSSRIPNNSSHQKSHSAIIGLQSVI